MPFFYYKRLNAQGRLEKKTEGLPFENIDAAQRYLESNRATVLSIWKFPRWLVPVAFFWQFGFASVNRNDLAEMFNNISMMLGAGIPVLSSLQEIRTDLQNKRLLGVIDFMITDISNGQTFSQAVARHPKIFSPIIFNMALIGEETGRLDKMLKKVAEHLQYIQHIVGETKRALIYPAFLFFVVSGAVIFWFWYVVPQIMSLFDDLNVELPAITLALIFISDLFQKYLFPAIIVFIASIFLIVLARRKIYRVRYATDWIILRVPVISTILHTSMVARISENLGTLIGAGATALRTLEIITNSLQNVVYKEKMGQVQKEIKYGNALADSMRRASALHPFAIRMIGVGEETARLEEQTAYVAEHFKERLDNLVQSLSKSLEPALLIFMGLMFGAIMAGLLLPIYDLVSTMGM